VFRVFESMKQCWIVGEAQIAPKPDQGGPMSFH
jgi:hypothetical protein